MKIALINGSPKAEGSGSECALQMLKPLLPAEYEFIEYNFRTTKVEDNRLEQIGKCNTLVFSFPLYVDGIPSHLLSCLYEMETYFKTKEAVKVNVYALVNNGFYEGHQNVIALEIMKNWCEKAGLGWKQGLGIGGGGMLQTLMGIPDGKGPKKNLSKALTAIAGNIAAGTGAEDIFISPNLPRIAYKIGAEMGWHQAAKANGLTPRDLGKRR